MSSPGLQTARVGPERDVVAPDGSDVRTLIRTEAASMSHFELPPMATSIAVRHRTIEELWFITGGRGRFWRYTAEGEESIDDLEPGVALAIPRRCSFQFRSIDDQPLSAVGTTIPPFPVGDDREVETVAGPWKPTVDGGADEAAG